MDLRERLTLISTPEIDRRYKDQIIEEVLLEFEREKIRSGEVVRLLEDTGYQRKRARVLQQQVNYYEAALRVISREARIGNARDVATKVIETAGKLYK